MGRSDGVSAPAPSCGGGQGWGVARTVEIGQCAVACLSDRTARPPSSILPHKSLRPGARKRGPGGGGGAVGRSLRKLKSRRRKCSICAPSSRLRLLPACALLLPRARRFPRLQQDARAHQYRGRDGRGGGVQNRGLVGRDARLLRHAHPRPAEEPLYLSLRHRHRRRGPPRRHGDDVHRPGKVHSFRRGKLLAARLAGGHLRRDRHARFVRLDDVPHRPAEARIISPS